MTAFEESPEPYLFDQPPALEPLSPFEEITSSVPRVSPFQALWNEAEELLHATRPDGFEVEEIGRNAFDGLPEAEKSDALDELFYTYWEATLDDEKALARSEELQSQRRELRYLLGRFEDLAEASSPVPYALLANIARLSLQLMGGAS